MKYSSTHEQNKTTISNIAFTYIGTEKKRITKLFKETPIKIVFRTQTKLGPLGTSATEWPIAPAPGDCDDGESGGMKIGRGN
jgi:hypothetical protein